VGESSPLFICRRRRRRRRPQDCYAYRTDGKSGSNFGNGKVDFCAGFAKMMREIRPQDTS